MPILIDDKELDLEERKKESLRQQKIRRAKKPEDKVIVKPGQDVASIADQYGASTEAIIAKNKGAFPLVTGQSLKLPRFDSEIALKPQPFAGQIHGGVPQFEDGAGVSGGANLQQNKPYTPPKSTGNILEDRKIGQYEIFRNAANITGQMSSVALQRLADISGITYQDAASNLRAQGFEFEPSTGKWVNPGALPQAGPRADDRGVSGNWETGWSIPGSTPNQSAYIAPNIHGSAWQVVIVEVSPGVWERRTVPTYGQRGRGGQGGPAHGTSGSGGGFGGGSGGTQPLLDQFGNPIVFGNWNV